MAAPDAPASGGDVGRDAGTTVSSTAPMDTSRGKLKADGQNGLIVPEFPAAVTTTRSGREFSKVLNAASIPRGGSSNSVPKNERLTSFRWSTPARDSSAAA